MKWEYRIESTKAAYDEKRLNELGDDGWKLVAVTGRVYHLKRERFVIKGPLKAPRKA